MNYINVPLSVNNNVEPTEGLSFNVTGIAGPYANEFTEIHWEWLFGSQVWILYAGGTRLLLYEPSTQEYTDYGETFICKSGEDLQNPEFVAWIEHNTHQSNDGIVLVTKYQMQYTANKIRAKRGTESPLSWSRYNGFGDAINSIYVGNDTRDGTALPFDIYNGVVAYSDEAKIIGTMLDANGVSF